MKIDMCVYLRTKFLVFSIFLTIKIQRVLKNTKKIVKKINEKVPKICITFSSITNKKTGKTLTKMFQKLFDN